MLLVLAVFVWRRSLGAAGEARPIQWGDFPFAHCAPSVVVSRFCEFGVHRAGDFCGHLSPASIV